MQSQHSIQVREAIISLRAKGLPYSEIAKSINNAGLGPISKGTVCYNVKKYNETNSVKNRPKSGRPRSKRTPRRIRTIRQKIQRSKKRSIRKMAREADMSPTSMRRLVKEDLGMTSYKIKKRQLLTEASIQKRLTRCTWLSKWLKMWSLFSVIWTDEKLFTVEADHNRQNDRVLAVTIEDVPINERTVARSQGKASVMVWAGVTSCGKKTPLVFIDKGVKIDQWAYQEMLAENIIPWIEAQDWPHGYVFQQDGAPAHTANSTQAWCHDHFQRVWPKCYWPPCSPDLNVMDFAIWGILAQKACATAHKSLDSLKRALQVAWDDLDPEMIRNSCLHAHKRMEAVVEANGGYIEDK